MMCVTGCGGIRAVVTDAARVVFGMPMLRPPLRVLYEPYFKDGAESDWWKPTR